MTETGGHSYLKSHEISGDALTLDIATESEGALQLARAAANGHAARTLVKSGALRIVIMGFMSGAALRQHKAAGPVSIHALSGQIEVVSPGRRDSLKAGQALMLGASVEHALEASEEATVLLTIAWPSA